MLKRQQIKDSKSNKMESRGSKRQQLDLYDNEEEESLDKFEDENKREGIRYVPFLFVAPPRKESNCPIDMDKETRSPNHLI